MTASIYLERRALFVREPTRFGPDQGASIVAQYGSLTAFFNEFSVVFGTVQAPAEDTHDGGGSSKKTSIRKLDFPTVFEPETEPDSTRELTSTGRAVVEAVLTEARDQEELSRVPAVSRAIKSPQDKAHQVAVAELVLLGELTDLLSFEFELLVMRLQQEEEDIAALLAMRML